MEVPGTAAARPPSEAAARQLEACVHCGFCLPACPTYREDAAGGEADSPRGRIDIMGALFRGEVSAAEPDVALHLDRCLDCRACETACPSGVRYHVLLEEAVARLPARRPWLARGGAEAAAYSGGMALVRLLLRHLVRRPRAMAWLLRLLRRLPAGVGAGVPAVGALLAGLPERPQRPARGRLPRAARGPRGARGGAVLFLGCVQDAVFGDDNAAAAGTLAACGFDVAVPAGQTCCGALHVHLGDRAGFRRVAAANCAALGPRGADQDPIVVAAAGCGAVLKDYGRLLAGTPLAERGAALAARVRDFAEFVAQAGPPAVAMPPAGAPVRVTWHDPCHLCHAQGVRAQPRDLLRAIPGLEFVELGEADACCGSAGVYNVLEPALSARVLERKVAHIAATGARWVVTENPGCAMQLQSGLRRAGLDVRVVGLAQVLADAYGAEGP